MLGIGTLLYIMRIRIQEVKNSSRKIFQQISNQSFTTFMTKNYDKLENNSKIFNDFKTFLYQYLKTLQLTLNFRNGFYYCFLKLQILEVCHNAVPDTKTLPGKCSKSWYHRALTRLPFSSYPFPATLFRLPFSSYPFPAALFRLPFSGYPFPASLFQLPFSSCPFPATLFRLPFSGYPFPAFLFWIFPFQIPLPSYPF